MKPGAKKIQNTGTMQHCILYSLGFITREERAICSWFQTAAMLWMLYSFFWVIPRRLKFMGQRFATLCLFHHHRAWRPMTMEHGVPKRRHLKCRRWGIAPQKRIQIELICNRFCDQLTLLCSGFWEYKNQSVKLTTYLLLVPDHEWVEVYLPSPYTPPWRGKRQFHLSPLLSSMLILTSALAFHLWAKGNRPHDWQTRA